MAAVQNELIYNAHFQEQEKEFSPLLQRFTLGNGPISMHF
jgi:hypothetical protein